MGHISPLSSQAYLASPGPTLQEVLMLLPPLLKKIFMEVFLYMLL